MIITELKSRLKPGCRAHLVGIGGVSMAPLAEVLHGMGVIVSGSDMKESKTVEHLRTSRRGMLRRRTEARCCSMSGSRRRCSSCIDARHQTWAVQQ